ncbi:MAG: hypothetical protein NTW14_12430, partial [bacterium]|nr:hypothetical protein [bacterium]
MNPFHKNARMRNSAKWRLSILTIALLLGAVAGTMTLQGQPNLNPHGAINLDCQLCHVTENWTKIRDDSQFDHSKTAFPLKGQHATVSCRSCHQSLEFKSADTRCAGCHQDIHANQFGDGCNRCHTPEMWVDEPQFKRMHQESRFPLVGAHSSVDCQLCHPGDRYANTPLDCYGCHLQTYAATTNPDHHGAGFSVNCGECHSMLVSSWVGNLAAFQHTPNFPLVGGHNINDCSTCHLPGSNYKQTTTTCFDCHQSAYETATPNHITGNFGTNCAVCHTIMGWSPAQFDHNITSFPLTGAHASVNCQACHSQGYAGTPTDCYSCHQSNFNGAANPIHTAPSFSYVCTLCHNTAGWSPSTFNHTIQTTYPLTGSHIATSCASCHPNGVYAGTSNLCWTCHQQDYINVQDPNHVANNYPHECEICHNTSSWGDAIFNHNQTNFPLTGAHTTVSCTQC